MEEGKQRFQMVSGNRTALRRHSKGIGTDTEQQTMVSEGETPQQSKLGRKYRHERLLLFTHAMARWEGHSTSSAPSKCMDSIPPPPELAKRCHLPRWLLNIPWELNVSIHSPRLRKVRLYPVRPPPVPGVRGRAGAGNAK
ncbi:molecular chaperone GroEL [Platysternon megacephalum]|uniref:Molecular chaperone GroEL n=1 Tax=Platysternon megacephalum TaxID=55544 RepID=A0A4D9DNB6_9SAUR|nr:molecular chaperone GroEL [Platysternon megacephalum]